MLRHSFGTEDLEGEEDDEDEDEEEEEDGEESDSGGEQDYDEEVRPAPPPRSQSTRCPRSYSRP